MAQGSWVLQPAWEKMDMQLIWQNREERSSAVQSAGFGLAPVVHMADLSRRRGICSWCWFETLCWGSTRT